MSYDLEVFAPRAASSTELHELITAAPTLAVDLERSHHITVVRGARRHYSFTIDGPDLVEPEDVDARVNATVLGANYLYSLHVEGSTSAEIPHASRFARRFAKALGGAVLDPQTDEVWSRATSRRVQPPPSQTRVSVVNLSWYCLRTDLAPQAAATYLTAARRELPEALPRRFGDYEPLQHKLADTGDDGFLHSWSEADTLFTTGSRPCLGGSLRGGSSTGQQDHYWYMSLTFLTEPLHQTPWRDAVQRLFLTLADELPAFYADAQVTNGWIWSGRSIAADGDTQKRISPLRYLDGWTGLPPLTPWWIWLGQPYARHHALLPTDRTTPTRIGAFYESTPQPSDCASAPPLATWLPAELFATVAPHASNESPVPLNHAKLIPPALSHSWE
ncbi:hypothetical protein ACQBAR_16820 [Propionibacteriaceae bacterium Y1685]